ncbi:MAG TPA: hypothetical protein DCQ83_08115 [Fibrobacteres bacterium]|jgi:hypothetical protein|nr:hypothetical protein [Fibrobacterota bacterium]
MSKYPVRLKSFFQLVRIPTVFSALSNVYAGYWIGGGIAGVTPLLSGLLAAGLYLMAGMALNDIADYKVDARERPERPLPSRAISLSAAWLFSMAMLGSAMILQWLANPVAAFVGALLALCILAYNFFLKGTFLGPLAMGTCRMLNLLCGITLNADSLSDIWNLPLQSYWILGSLGVYIFCVTYLARDEVGGNTKARARVFFAGLMLWMGAWIGFAAFHPSLLSFILFAVLLCHLWLLSTALRNLRTNPGSPASTGKLVGMLLRTMPLTDVVAMLSAAVAVPWALLGLAWMLPGPFLARRFYST